MKLEFGPPNELRLLTHVIDIKVNYKTHFRLFLDFSCKFTENPVLFTPWTVIKNE